MDSQRSSGCSVRFLILLATILVLTVVYANPTSFYFTVICMMPEDYEENSNSSIADSKWTFNFSPIQGNALMSAAAIGTLIGSIPLSFCIGKFGLRKTFAAYTLMSAASTLLLPISGRIGYFPILIIRVIQGLGPATSLVMINSVSTEWSSAEYAGTYMILLSTHFQLGPLYSMPMAGYLCESRWGWPMVYYIQGILTLVSLALFYAIFTDDAAKHPYITTRELVIIKTGKDETMRMLDKSAQETPYRTIFSDYVVWLCLLAFFGDMLGYIIFTQYGPTFLNKALGMNVEQTGLASALPYLLSIVAKLIAGPVNDRLVFLTETARINVFVVISQGGAILCYTSLALIPTLFDNPPTWLIQTFYSSINLFSGLSFLGIIKSAAVISQQFSHALMAGEVMISSVIVLVIPVLVTFVAPNNTVAQWSRIFIGMPILQTITAGLFLLFCDSKPRHWTHSRRTKSEKYLKYSGKDNGYK